MKFRVSVIDFIPFNGKIPAKTKVGGNAIDIMERLCLLVTQ